ncbi:MAG: cation diffusion facilitator family transporter, partial [bacterium]
MVIEAAGGLISGSLALLADAGHMLSDATAILFSLIAVQIGRREATGRHTYGVRRAEFLAAFVNAIELVALAVWIVTEAVERFGDPRPILSGVMLWVALAGLVVNLAALRLLHGHAAGNLNLRSALWHIMGDLLGSIGAVAAALISWFTGWTTIDPLLSIAIATLIGLAGARNLYDSANL